MDQSLLRKPIYSKLLALYDNYDVSKVIHYNSVYSQYKRVEVVLLRWTHQGENF